MSAPCRPPRSSAKRWCAWCSPMRCSSASAAIPCGSSRRTSARRPRAHASALLAPARRRDAADHLLMLRPDRPLRRPRAAASRRRDVERHHAGDHDAHRRHGRDDVRGARHRAGRAAGRRAAAHLRHRSVGRPRPGRADHDDQPGVRRARRHAARGRGLPERSRVQRHRGAAAARGRARPGPRRARSTRVEGTGLLARAFQHEMDHLDGRLFVDRLRGIKRDIIVRKIRKLARAGEW